MGYRNRTPLLICLAIIFVGLVIVKDTYDLKNSYVDTFEVAMEPITRIAENPLNPSEFFDTFDKEKYVRDSTSKVTLTTIEAMQYRIGLPGGISCIVGGFAALLYRERKTINDFTTKFVGFFLGLFK